MAGRVEAVASERKRTSRTSYYTTLLVLAMLFVGTVMLMGSLNRLLSAASPRFRSTTNKVTSTPGTLSRFNQQISVANFSTELKILRIENDYASWVDPEDPPSQVFTRPARYFNRTPMFIWGGRLTRSIISPDDIALDFWVHSTLFMTDEWCNSTFNASRVLVGPEELFNTKLLLMIPSSNSTHVGAGETGRRSCLSKPNANMDLLPRSAFVRFRCNLTAGELTPHGKGYRFRLHNSHGEAVDLQIPEHSESFGVGGADNALPDPISKRKQNTMTLCVGGVSDKGLNVLGEFFEHHLRMGIDYFVVSLHASKRLSGATNINADIKTTLASAETLYKKLVVAGVVSFVPMWIPKEFNVVDRDVLKVLFYEQCLFHAKGLSELAGNWDVDEFFMPAPQFLQQADIAESKSPIEQLLDAIEPYKSCPDWCYMTFPSHSIFYAPEQPEVNPAKIKSIADTFRIRSTVEPNYIWQKSIAKTKNAFNSGCTFALRLSSS